MIDRLKCEMEALEEFEHNVQVSEGALLVRRTQSHQYPDGFRDTHPHLVFSWKGEDFCLVRDSLGRSVLLEPGAATYVFLSVQGVLCQSSPWGRPVGVSPLELKREFGVHPHEFAIRHILSAASSMVQSGWRICLHTDLVEKDGKKLCRNGALRDRFFERGSERDWIQADFGRQRIFKGPVSLLNHNKKRVREVLDC